MPQTRTHQLLAGIEPQAQRLAASVQGLDSLRLGNFLVQLESPSDKLGQLPLPGLEVAGLLGPALDRVPLVSRNQGRFLSRSLVGAGTAA